MKTLYANGDSFIFGMEALEDFSRTENNKEYAFAKHVATGLQCDTYINNSYNGATNDFIFRNTIFDLMELEKSGIDPADIFVIIGWTALHRVEFDGTTWFNRIPGFKQNTHKFVSEDAPEEFKDFGTLFVNPTFGIIVQAAGKLHDIRKDTESFCVDYLWTDRLQIPQQEARIIALHEFLESRGYKHVFLNTVDKVEYFNLDVNCVNFYKLNTEAFYNWASTTHSEKQRMASHYGAEVYDEYGKILLNYILENIS